MLEQYQCGPAAWLQHHPKQKGLGCFFGTGFGKSLTGVAVSITLLKSKLVTGVLAITPKSLLQNMKNSFNVCGGVDAAMALKVTRFVTYEKVESAPDSIGEISSKTLVIIDEAHRLRESSTSTYKTIKSICDRADKVLLLTATPMVNGPNDALNLLRLINADLQIEEMSPKQFGIVCDKLVAFPDVDKSCDFPRLEKHVVKVPLDADQVAALRAYDRKFRATHGSGAGKNSYLVKTRQLSMGLPPKPSSKLFALLENVQKSRGRVLVFAEFVKSGVEYITSFLRSRLLLTNVEMLTGQTDAKKRGELVQRFNDGDVHVLVMSAAGQEGLDFKEVRSIHHMNTDWNPADVDQKNGRGCRFKSHDRLPPKDRVVHSYQYVSIPPDGEDKCKRRTGGECTEAHLFAIEEKKRREIGLYMEELLNASIPHVCDDDVCVLSKSSSKRVTKVKNVRMCSAQSLPVGFSFDAFNGYHYKVIETRTGRKMWRRA